MNDEQAVLELVAALKPFAFMADSLDDATPNGPVAGLLRDRCEFARHTLDRVAPGWRE